MEAAKIALKREEIPMAEYNKVVSLYQQSIFSFMLYASCHNFQKMAIIILDVLLLLQVMSELCVSRGSVWVLKNGDGSPDDKMHS